MRNKSEDYFIYSKAQNEERVQTFSFYVNLLKMSNMINSEFSGRKDLKITLKAMRMLRGK